MNEEILQHYKSLARTYQSQLETQKKILRFISLGRFICFISIFPAYYYLHQTNKFLALSASIVLVVGFFLLIKKFILTENQLLFYRHLVEINQNEIKAMNRDFSSFDPGIEFIDPHHDYSYDLDLYGTGSIFQFLNRTVTMRGKNRLSGLLNQSQRSSGEIEDRQLAIQELAEEIDWRQNFLAKGMETEEKQNGIQIDGSIGALINLKSAQTIRFLLITLPALTILLTALNISGVYTNSAYLAAIFSQWIIFILYSKTITKFHKQFERQAKGLNRYSEMLLLIEKKTFKSSYLVLLKEKLSNQGKTASQITSELQKILNEFDYRQNILVGFVLNSVLLWDIRCLSKLNRWQKIYENDLSVWFEVIAEFDALASLSNCNYNHPEWAIPAVRHSDFHFITSNLGHPLIDEKKCVRNSFTISDEEQIVIITGANMAGKSTFLRTVGVNLVLAANGCKVCAESLEFSPTRIFTNMRTSDNLMNDESYFYAELLRLQTLLTLLRKGENLFIIIDEMLKGTNSTDKLNGSKELVNQLISLNAHGIVATHDLGLTELVQKYPDSIKNQCFEVLLHADELKFDYKLSEGVTRTMNATFLMKKMGIIPKE
jgi:DNA mismatch repair ATPase MutS